MLLPIVEQGSHRVNRRCKSHRWLPRTKAWRMRWRRIFQSSGWARC